MLAALIIFLCFANINMVYLNILYTQFETLSYFKTINDKGYIEANIINAFKTSYNLETNQFEYNGYLIDFYTSEDSYQFYYDGANFIIYYKDNNLTHYDINY